MDFRPSVYVLISQAIARPTTTKIRLNHDDSRFNQRKYATNTISGTADKIHGRKTSLHKLWFDKLILLSDL